MASEVEKYLIDGYYPTIGIECHVQLKTKTKLFSAISNEAREAKPNSLISHICFGLPGALPVLNGEAIRLASVAGFALGSKPQKFSKFDRKHYFYPDLPKGYQITQYDQPIILDGGITIHLDDGTQKTVKITRAHLEEDAGKSTHPTGADYSLVDFNRAGTPLLEIVSEPELHSPQEAKAYARELWLRMKYAGVSDVDLYHGNMRFDVNVSVSKDTSKLGTRSETKNLNSFKSVERAVEYEIKRQIQLLEKGELVVQETRGWVDDKQKTVSQRSKEDAHDYRYFPDPDIPPVVLEDSYIKEIEDSLPVTPDEWRQRLKSSGLDGIVIEELLLADAEDNRVSYLGALNHMTEPELVKRYANWVLNIFVPLQRETSGLIRDESEILRAVTSVHDMLQADKLNSNNAKALLEEVLIMQTLPDDIEEYAGTKGYLQVSDFGQLESIVDKVIADNPKPVSDIQQGELKAIGFLVGQVMKLSEGAANPSTVQEILKARLGVK